VSRPAGRPDGGAGRSLRTRLTVIAATAITVSVFVAFQVGIELLDGELQDTAENQVRIRAVVSAALTSVLPHRGTGPESVHGALGCAGRWGYRLSPACRCRMPCTADDAYGVKV
jgi:hypothetical protein